MTTLKMIVAVLGSLIFLGLFAVGFNSAQHQEITLKNCEGMASIQEISSVSFTCSTTKNLQLISKG
jgi:hypothetical protein